MVLPFALFLSMANSAPRPVMLPIDAATLAGLPRCNAIQRPALQTLIVAEATDACRVMFSLGEIDARLGNRHALLIPHCDGQKLSGEGGPLRLGDTGDGARRAVGATAGIPACDHPVRNDHCITDHPV